MRMCAMLALATVFLLPVFALAQVMRTNPGSTPARRTTAAPRDEAFWTNHYTVRANDWIGAAGLLSFDQVHHRIALFPADRPGSYRSALFESEDGHVLRQRHQPPEPHLPR